MEEHDLDKILENCCDQQYEIITNTYGCVRPRHCEHALYKSGEEYICALKSSDEIVQYLLNRDYQYLNKKN
jgi:hypothetical protein